MRRRLSPLLLAAALAALAPQPARALALVYDGGFASTSPDGIAFDPVSGHLFIVDDGNTVREVATDGTPVASFTVSNSLADGEGLEGATLLPNGSLALVDDGDEIVFERTTSGGLPGLAMLPGAQLDLGGIAAISDPNGIAFDPGDGSLLFADESNEALYRVSMAGSLLDTIDLTLVIPSVADPEGILVLPGTGEILFVDDSGADAGTLYRLSATGSLLSAVDLAALSPGLDDPEGLAFDPATGTLFVAFESQDFVARYTVPEPGGLALLGAAWLAVGRLRRRRT